MKSEIDLSDSSDSPLAQCSQELYRLGMNGARAIRRLGICRGRRSSPRTLVTPRRAKSGSLSKSNQISGAVGIFGLMLHLRPAVG